MRTGTFAIDYMQVGLLSIGSAELTTGFLGEPIARLRVLAPDGDYYDQYWLRVDPVESRIEYLYFDETEGGVIRGDEWAIDNVAEWLVEDDEEMLATFAEMTRVAESLGVEPLRVGAEVETLGGLLEQEDLGALEPLWAPAGDEP